MTDHQDNLHIEIPCPTCGRKTAEPLQWFVSHRVFTCPCGQPIEIRDEDLRLLEEQWEEAAERMANRR